VAHSRPRCFLLAFVAARAGKNGVLAGKRPCAFGLRRARDITPEVGPDKPAVFWAGPLLMANGRQGLPESRSPPGACDRFVIRRRNKIAPSRQVELVGLCNFLDTGCTISREAQGLQARTVSCVARNHEGSQTRHRHCGGPDGRSQRGVVNDEYIEGWWIDSERCRHFARHIGKLATATQGLARARRRGNDW